MFRWFQWPNVVFIIFGRSSVGSPASYVVVCQPVNRLVHRAQASRRQRSTLRCLLPVGSFRRKKRMSGPLTPVPASVASPSAASAHGLFVKDQLSGRLFHVDTGAGLSVFPASDFDRARGPSRHPDYSLFNASGIEIKTFGKRTMSLRFNSQVFTWKFILADVRGPLLRADFLSQHNLLVDVKGQRLIEADNYLSVGLQRRTCVESVAINRV